MTKSELNRRAHLDKALRDTRVGRFAAEGLVRIEGKTITATTYREFVTGLYRREEFPQPTVRKFLFRPPLSGRLSGRGWRGCSGQDAPLAIGQEDPLPPHLVHQDPDLGVLELDNLLLPAVDQSGQYQE